MRTAILILLACTQGCQANSVELFPKMAKQADVDNIAVTQGMIATKLDKIEVGLSAVNASKSAGGNITQDATLVIVGGIASVIIACVVIWLVASVAKGAGVRADRFHDTLTDGVKAIAAVGTKVDAIHQDVREIPSKTAAMVHSIHGTVNAPDRRHAS